MPRTFAPSQLAERYHVDHSKVLLWIAKGELRAVNVAANASGRPRWRIPEEALQEFEQARGNSRQTTARKKPVRVERRYY